MSQRTVSAPPPRGPMGGPMGGFQGKSDAKAQDFRGSLKRFGSRLRPERLIVVVVIVLAFASVFLAVLGPGLLAGLSDDHREILLLRFVDGFTLDEIATALQIPIGTAKSRLHHAIAQLREDPRARKYFENL